MSRNGFVPVEDFQALARRWNAPYYHSLIQARDWMTGQWWRQIQLPPIGPHRSSVCPGPWHKMEVWNWSISGDVRPQIWLASGSTSKGFQRLDTLHLPCRHQCQSLLAHDTHFTMSYLPQGLITWQFISVLFCICSSIAQFRSIAFLYSADDHIYT